MVENTKIEWADHTFNPWVGYTKVSPACDHCYAEGWARRTGQAQLWQGERRRTSEATWQQPLKWNRQAEREGRRFRVFCASLADVFDNRVPERWRDDLWHRIHQTPHLDWLLLTKRPQNIAKMLPTPAIGAPAWGEGWPNVWLGTTVENQAEASRRIPHLLDVNARVRFLSCEPLLGPTDLTAVDPLPNHPHPDVLLSLNALTGIVAGPDDQLPRIDWVIAGGESGPGARPSHPDWFRSLRDQCAAAGVPFHFKQHGDWREWDHQPGTVDEVDNDSETADAIAASAINPAWISRDGRVFHRRQDLPADIPCRLVERLGKTRAGRLLDGVEHNGMPGHG